MLSTHDMLYICWVMEVKEVRSNPTTLLPSTPQPTLHTRHPSSRGAYPFPAPLQYPLPHTLTSHHSPLNLHPSPLTHHPLTLTPHHSPVTPFPSSITHHSSPFNTPQHPSHLVPSEGGFPQLRCFLFRNDFREKMKKWCFV